MSYSRVLNDPHFNSNSKGKNVSSNILRHSSDLSRIGTYSSIHLDVQTKKPRPPSNNTKETANHVSIPTRLVRSPLKQLDDLLQLERWNFKKIESHFDNVSFNTCIGPETSDSYLSLMLQKGSSSAKHSGNSPCSVTSHKMRRMTKSNVSPPHKHEMSKKHNNHFQLNHTVNRGAIDRHRRTSYHCIYMPNNSADNSPIILDESIKINNVDHVKKQNRDNFTGPSIVRIFNSPTGTDQINPDKERRFSASTFAARSQDDCGASAHSCTPSGLKEQPNSNIAFQPKNNRQPNLNTTSNIHAVTEVSPASMSRTTPICEASIPLLPPTPTPQSSCAKDETQAVMQSSQRVSDTQGASRPTSSASAAAKAFLLATSSPTGRQQQQHSAEDASATANSSIPVLHDASPPRRDHANQPNPSVFSSPFLEAVLKHNLSSGASPIAISPTSPSTANFLHSAMRIPLLPLSTSPLLPPIALGDLDSESEQLTARFPRLNSARPSPRPEGMDLVEDANGGSQGRNIEPSATSTSTSSSTFLEPLVTELADPFTPSKKADAPPDECKDEVSRIKNNISYLPHDVPAPPISLIKDCGELECNRRSSTSSIFSSSVLSGGFNNHRQCISISSSIVQRRKQHALIWQLSNIESNNNPSLRDMKLSDIPSYRASNHQNISNSDSKQRIELLGARGSFASSFAGVHGFCSSSVSANSPGLSPLSATGPATPIETDHITLHDLEIADKPFSLNEIRDIQSNTEFHQHHLEDTQKSPLVSPVKASVDKGIQVESSNFAECLMRSCPITTQPCLVEMGKVKNNQTVELPNIPLKSTPSSPYLSAATASPTFFRQPFLPVGSPAHDSESSYHPSTAKYLTVNTTNLTSLINQEMHLERRDEETALPVLSSSLRGNSESATSQLFLNGEVRTQNESKNVRSNSSHVIKTSNEGFKGASVSLVKSAFQAIDLQREMDMELIESLQDSVERLELEREVLIQRLIEVDGLAKDAMQLGGCEEVVDVLLELAGHLSQDKLPSATDNNSLLPVQLQFSDDAEGDEVIVKVEKGFQEQRIEKNNVLQQQPRPKSTSLLNLTTTSTHQRQSEIRSSLNSIRPTTAPPAKRVDKNYGNGDEQPKNSIFFSLD